MKKYLIDQEDSIVRRLVELMDVVGPSQVHELIEMFFKVGRRDFDLMKMAIQDSSPEKFIEAAHGLKTSSLNLGALQLGAACKNAESFKFVHSKAKAQEILATIEGELSNVEGLLIGYIKETQDSVG